MSKEKENVELTEEEVITENVTNEETEEMEKVEQMEIAIRESGNSIVESFGQPRPTETRKKIRSTITDPKTLFNLQDHVDFRLNDMEGKELEIVDVVIEEYEKDIPERVNKFTGEVETVERSIVTKLVDKTGTSYVTASKMFAFRIGQFVDMIGVQKLKEGQKILITKTVHKDTGNKKLGFEIV